MPPEGQTIAFAGCFLQCISCNFRAFFTKSKSDWNFEQFCSKMPFFSNNFRVKIFFVFTQYFTANFFISLRNSETFLNFQLFQKYPKSSKNFYHKFRLFFFAKIAAWVKNLARKFVD